MGQNLPRVSKNPDQMVEDDDYGRPRFEMEPSRRSVFPAVRIRVLTQELSNKVQVKAELPSKQLALSFLGI
jgi:hypothetical protein